MQGLQRRFRFHQTILYLPQAKIGRQWTIGNGQKLINGYYESKAERNDEDSTEEADKVSARIAKILGEKSFNFSPSYLIAIHEKLFQGIYKFAGKTRNYDISKKEWVLNGDSVMYGAAFELKTALDYDFEQERNFIYSGLSLDRIAEHLAYSAIHGVQGFERYFRKKLLVFQKRTGPRQLQKSAKRYRQESRIFGKIFQKHALGQTQ